MKQKKTLKIHPNDNVEVALSDLKSNDFEIKRGHKIALVDIKKGDEIIKYGHSIGHAITDIKKGDHVHSHNMVTNLSGALEYSYNPVNVSLIPKTKRTFLGYKRKDGRDVRRANGCIP